MKKNYLMFLYALVISCVSLSFASCSDDDDDDGNDGGNISFLDATSIEFYLNGQKQLTTSISEDKPIYRFVDSQGLYIRIPSNDPEKTVFGMWVNDYRNDYNDDIINTIKVGDNLVNGNNLVKHEIGFEMTTNFEGKYYWIDDSHCKKEEYKNCQGSIIVKSINTKTRELTLEFKDIRLPILNEYNRPIPTQFIAVNGTVKSIVKYWKD